ncbi:MAG: acetylxylan esterase [Armatimonadetes bacterium]|nr:acetylxylan esterase [Armatimonadota bacterium]
MKRPADFGDFWRRTKEALAETPPEWERVPDEAATTPDLAVDWLRFPSLHGRDVYGWLAVPRKSRPAGNAGYLWLPGYSWGNPPPGPESLYPNTVTLGLNLHGNLPNTPYVHPFTQGKEYITQGIESPETYIYRDIVCHCLRALAVLAAQPEVDERKMIVGGMSQGGGLALVTAALASDRAKLCFADMPWLCDLDRALSLIDRSKYRGGRRIPDGRALIEDYADIRPELRGQIFQTYRYFDPLSHAAGIRCPTQMSAGGRDPSCRPPTIFAVYNEITAEKEMLYLPNTGHEIVPAMHAAHQRWVQTRLGGES